MGGSMGLGNMFFGACVAGLACICIEWYIIIPSSCRWVWILPPFRFWGNSNQYEQPYSYRPRVPLYGNWSYPNFRKWMVFGLKLKPFIVGHWLSVLQVVIELFYFMDRYSSPVLIPLWQINGHSGKSDPHGPDANLALSTVASLGRGYSGVCISTSDQPFFSATVTRNLIGTYAWNHVYMGQFHLAIGWIVRS